MFQFFYFTLHSAQLWGSEHRWSKPDMIVCMVNKEFEWKIKLTSNNELSKTDKILLPGPGS